MGLKEVFQAAAVTGVKAAGNVAVSVLYESIQPPDYDISSGEVTSQDNVYSIEAIFVDFTEQEKQTLQIVTADKKALIAASTILFTPKTDDILISDGVRWVVTKPMIDPAGALWILPVRQP